MIQSTKTEFDSEDECLSEINRLRLLLQRYTLLTEVIPIELARSNQWVVWTYKVRKQENGMFAVTKQPYQSKNPKSEVSKYCASDWSDLTTALGCLRENSDFDGIGYMFAEGDGLIGVDFDNCRDHFTGIIRPEFQFWINKFSSYTEISPSGAGVKVWIKGSVADNYFKYAESTGFRILNFAGGEIEIYRSGQYFTVTTQTLNGINSIRDAQAELDVICEFSLSKTQRDFRYSSCPDYQLAEQEENIERSILKTYDDLINLTYIYEPGIQHNLMKETATDTLDANLPSINRDRFGKSKCNNCDENSHGYELCRKCYAAARPEEEVEDAVCEYFSKLLEFSVVRQPNHEITFGSKKMIPDVVLLDSEKNLVAIAECKREGITYNGIEQLKSYLSASDTQFGIFANSIEPDDWTFYENLRRHRFEENIPRSRFETEIKAQRTIESIRTEKSRLDKEIIEERKNQKQIRSEIAYSNQKLAELNGNIVQKGQELIRIKVEINSLSKESSDLKKEINENSQKVEVLKFNQLKSTHDTLNAEINSKETELNTMKNLKVQLQNKIGTMDYEIKNLAEKYDITLKIKNLDELKKRLHKEVLEKQRESENLTEKINMLETKKEEFEKKQNKIGSERRKLERDKQTWWKEKEKNKAGIAYLESQKEKLEKQIKSRTKAIRDLNRLARLDEMETRFDKESIYGQLRKEFEWLQAIESDIASKQLLALDNQEKHAIYEKNKVEIGNKVQLLIRVSQERETILKQLTEIVNRLKTANPEQKEQIEAHRKKLADDVRNQKNKCIQLETEIRMLQDEKSKLKLETNFNEHQFPFAVIDILPTYLQMEEEIDKLKTRKYELEAEIGHKIFKIIPKKIEISTPKSKEN